jgi:hypothetical protein
LTIVTETELVIENPLVVGGITTGFLVGGAFGARHAFEADHVAAVATLVERDRGSVTTGAAWGVGHSLPILLLGAVFLAADLRIPARVGTVFELLVAAVLVVLGFRVLAGRGSIGLALLRHVHGDGEGDGDGDGARAAGGDRPHRHVALAGTRVGLAHSHADEESLAVGVVHGLAGGGGVVVALAAAAPTVARGVAFLLGFSLASVVAMGVAAWAWGRAVGHARALRVAAGVGSVVVGALLFAEIAGLAVPL